VILEGDRKRSNFNIIKIKDFCLLSAHSELALFRRALAQHQQLLPISATQVTDIMRKEK
jgi:hypothetical protein